MPVTPEQRKKKAGIREFLDSLVAEPDNTPRYKSESFRRYELAKLYYGQPYKDTSEEDEARGSRRADQKSPNPSSTPILGADVSFGEWLDLRDKARKDLFWLGQTVLKKDFVSTTHQIVCDQFVQKNFDGMYREGYTLGEVHKAIDKQPRFDAMGNPTKEMILLDSRGFFKSSIDGVDCVQWMINVPDIRILILTGEYKLAVAFMKEIKGYLYLAKGEDPTDFHLLFPEFVLRGLDGTSKEPFTLDCRKHKQKEATVWVNSIDSNLSGWHCDVKKGDDVVTDENCNTQDAREQLKEKFDGTGNLLDEWGFSDNIGTRYYPDDWYGTRLLSAAEDNTIKYFCRQCWTVKPEYVETPLKKLTAEMVVLTFPEKATFASLRRKLLTNEISFRNQQLNEPVADHKDDGFRVTFEEDVLKAHMYQASAAPKDGDIFIAWDWAPSSNKYSDYSVGVAARVYLKGTENTVSGPSLVMGLCVLEIVFGKWKASDLATQVVQFSKRWNPKRMLIEKTQGADLLELALQQAAYRYATTLNIFWKPPSSEENAKRNRIKGLETLLSEDRLYFIMGPWLDETFSQLMKYTGEKKNKGRKDDIPDAMSYLSFFLPTTAATAADTEAIKRLRDEERKSAEKKESYNRIFGTPFAKPAEEPVVSSDPRNKIFGGNGMRV